MAGNLFDQQDNHGQDYDSSSEHQLGRSSGVAFLISTRVGIVCDLA
jgi:hypothetical protein